MSDNKAKRDELEKIYGSGSMFQKSRAEERRRRQEKREMKRIKKELEDR